VGGSSCGEDMIRPLLGTDTTKLGGWLVTEKGMISQILVRRGR